MNGFLHHWHEAAVTSAGFFWTALWAFALGYLISSLIQVLVTRGGMQAAMGRAGPKSMALGTFFGFISSSCSFAALATTRALFQKGAGLAPAMAFLLASTNLVIELGIVIAIFLSWQFVVGEYLGGALLIGFAWLFIRLTRPNRLIRQARERLGDSAEQDEAEQIGDWREKISSWQGWQLIGQKYVMEWQMVWKDVLIGFTVAGIISAFVPDSFFEALFIGADTKDFTTPGFWSVLAQAVVGPVAAFFTFIGSMGNIPLAALLFDHGVSFAGVMAFIFSDLVVLPALRINAAYYGWRMALYLLLLMFSGIVAAALLMHYGFVLFDILPRGGPEQSITERDHFRINYGFVLNCVFLTVTAAMIWLSRQGRGSGHHHHHGGGETSWIDRILQVLVVLAALWLVLGLMLPLWLGGA